MEETQDPIQELVAAARRKQILDAATTVFAAKGFHGATIKDIARTASVADGTIYNYFDNKTALLIAILDRLNESDQRAAHFDVGAEQDVRLFFTTYLRHRMQLLHANSSVFQAILPEVLANAELREIYFSRIVQPTLLIGERALAGRTTPAAMRPLDAPLTVRIMAGTALGLLLLALLGDPELATRWDELPDLMADLFLKGMGFSDD